VEFGGNGAGAQRFSADGFFEAARTIVRIRIKPTNVPFLDGWRGICILLVMAGHFVSYLFPLARTGVEFFFALSGRLMAEILIIRRQPIGKFLKRRFARILPGLFFYVCVVAVLVNSILWRDGEPTNWISPLAALLFFHNYIPPSDILTVFEHCWSLAVEEHSYLTLVVVALIARRNPRVAMLLALAISMLAIANGVRIWDHQPNGGQYYLRRSDVRVASVLLSFSACLALQGFDLGQRKPRRFIAPAATVLALLFVSNGGATGPLRMAMGSICGAIAVNTLDISPDAFRAVLSTPVLVWFGTISFSLYLWQQIFFTAAHGGGSSLIAASLAVAFALASFKYVEQPARDFLNSHWGRSETYAPVDEPHLGLESAG